MTLEFAVSGAEAPESDRWAHTSSGPDRVPTAKMVTVDFVVPAAVGGTFADLVAEFVAWVPLPMARRDDGSFHTRIRLAACEEWKYRFLVDGDRLINDWDADDYVIDADAGGCFSLVRT